MKTNLFLLTDIELLMRGDATPKGSPKSPQSVDRTQSQSSRGTPDSAEAPPSGTSSVFTTGMDNEYLLGDTVETESDISKHDSRLSRRKTDRPRKRKRDSTDSVVPLQNPDVNMDCDIQRKTSSVSDRISPTEKPDDCALNLSSGNQSLPNSPGQSRMSQQGPKDLSLVHKSGLSKNDSNLKEPANVISSSVHELEKAMSRHLPSRSKGPYLQSQSRSPSDQHWPSPFCFAATSSSYSVPFCNSNIHTNRQSVIRSNLTGRLHGVNGDGGPIGMLGPSSSDVTIHKDQLHLNIPHITSHSKHLFHSQKDIVPGSDEYGMTPPSSVSPHEKVSGGYPDSDINSDCLGMRGAHRPINTSGKCHFQGVADTANDMTKQHFLSVPSYPFHSPDLSVFSHPAQATGGVLLENRPSNSSGMWYGSSTNPT